jgi:hypothetical protein
MQRLKHSPLNYVGRFAPSPTGPLHAGSLRAAMASYLDARAHHGRWLLRIEDLDTARAVPDAAHHIIQTLAAFGMDADGDIVWQSAGKSQTQESVSPVMARPFILAPAAMAWQLAAVLTPGDCACQRLVMQKARFVLKTAGKGCSRNSWQQQWATLY